MLKIYRNIIRVNLFLSGCETVTYDYVNEASGFMPCVRLVPDEGMCYILLNKLYCVLLIRHLQL
jgi:hypothetical protein